MVYLLPFLSYSAGSKSISASSPVQPGYDTSTTLEATALLSDKNWLKMKNEINEVSQMHPKVSTYSTHCQWNSQCSENKYMLVLSGQMQSTSSFTTVMIVRPRVQITPRTQVGQSWIYLKRLGSAIAKSHLTRKPTNCWGYEKRNATQRHSKTPWFAAGFK